METYKFEELFEEDPNDPESLIGTFPPNSGFLPGDTVRISVDNNGYRIIFEKVNKEDES